MWLLRRNSSAQKVPAQASPVAVSPMRRTEITVDRLSITRWMRSDEAGPAVVEDPLAPPDLRLPKPPDG